MTGYDDATGWGTINGAPLVPALASLPVPLVTVIATTPNAGNSPVTPGVVTVSCSPAPTTALTVNYSVSGTAVPGTDYTALSGSVTIPAGQSSATVTVTPLAGDTAITAPSVVLTLASGTGYNPGTPATATVTITEPVPVLITVVATMPSGSEKPVKSGVFTVARTASTAAALTVSYSMSGTAVPGTDYKALSGSLTIPKGKYSATVTVTPLAASTASGYQTAVLALSAGSGYEVDSPESATVTINEGAPLSGKLSVSPTTLAFGIVKVNTGTRMKSFTIKNTGKGPLTGQVGTPTAAAFTATPTGSFTLEPGDSQKVSVTYTPTKGAAASGKLAISGGGSTVNVSLSGKGK